MIEYQDLPESQQTQLIVTGMQMLKTVTEVYGVEQGEQLYNAIADSFGPGVKNAILFSMLTGKTFGITMRSVNWSINDFIQTIKCVRKYSECGLKEAKDLCDDVRAGKVVSFNLPNISKRHECVNELIKLGVDAS